MTVQLSTILNIPTNEIGQYSLMFVGEKKIGKTSLAVQFPDHYVLEGEPGNAKHLECLFTDIHNWAESKDVINQFTKDPNICKTLIIDDVPSYYDYALEQARLDTGQDLTSKDSFTVWKVAKVYFNKWIRQIEALPIGKIYTAHVKVRESKPSRAGATLETLEPSWSGQCKEVLDKYMKLTGYMMWGPDFTRFMQIQGDGYILANNGFTKSHFLSSGVPLKKIPLGTSPEEAYSNLISAWNNEFINGEVPKQTQTAKIDLSTLLKQQEEEL